MSRLNEIGIETGRIFIGIDCVSIVILESPFLPSRQPNASITNVNVGPIAAAVGPPAVAATPGTKGSCNTYIESMIYTAGAWQMTFRSSSPNVWVNYQVFGEVSPE